LSPSAAALSCTSLVCLHLQFSSNAGCGYVLKPTWMLPGPGATGVNPLPQRQPGTLRVHVYGAYCAQSSNIGVLKDDLYLEVRLLTAGLSSAPVPPLHRSPDDSRFSA
jgi:hypothetical protein